MLSSVITPDMILILLIGIALVFGQRAVAAFRRTHRLRNSWEGMLGTAPTTIAELRQRQAAVTDELGAGVPLQHDVTVTGVAQPSAHGFVSPLSNVPCAWYTVERRRRTVRTSGNSRDVDEIVEHVHSSSGKFTLTDQTGEITVRTENVDVQDLPTSQQVTSEDLGVMRVLGGTQSIDRIETEHFVPVGAQVTASGRATADGAGLLLEAPPGGSLVITTKSRSEFLSGRQQQQTSGARALAFHLTVTVLAGIGAIVLLIVN